jgi:hypothetical protein
VTGRRRSAKCPKTPGSPNKTYRPVYWPRRSRSTAQRGSAHCEPAASSAPPLSCYVCAYALLLLALTLVNGGCSKRRVDMKPSGMLACQRKVSLQSQRLFGLAEWARGGRAGRSAKGPRQRPRAQVGGESTDAGTGTRTPAEERHRLRAPLRRPLPFCIPRSSSRLCTLARTVMRMAERRALEQMSVGNRSFRVSARVLRCGAVPRCGAVRSRGAASTAIGLATAPRRASRSPTTSVPRRCATGARADDERVPKRQRGRRRRAVAQ